MRVNWELARQAQRNTETYAANDSGVAEDSDCQSNLATFLLMEQSWLALGKRGLAGWLPVVIRNACNPG